MFRLFSIVFALTLPTALGQTQTPPQRRTPPPTRDPRSPGYVKAIELPDGALPSPKADGNFIIGPAHNPAPDMMVREGVPHGAVYNFVMESNESKTYPGIARVPLTFGRPDPADPQRLLIESHPAPYTRKVAVYVRNNMFLAQSPRSSSAPTGPTRCCLPPSIT